MLGADLVADLGSSVCACLRCRLAALLVGASFELPFQFHIYLIYLALISRPSRYVNVVEKQTTNVVKNKKSTLNNIKPT